MIVTFYSYKGGVGRSFCLANVAVQLATWGNRVLCVDWDLAAPGLHEYFGPFLGRQPEMGLVELVGKPDNSPIDWREALVPVQVPNAETLHLLAAGRLDESYAERAQKIYWPDLFERYDLGWRLEDFSAAVRKEYDFVLLDSRTGVTDVGGICTAQLPDVLVLCTTPNWQSLRGVTSVASRAVTARNDLLYGKAGLHIVPVVTRFDHAGDETRMATWKQHIADECVELFESWVPRDTDPASVVAHMTIPYDAHWSFGEEIASLSPHNGTSGVVGRVLDNVAALLSHSFADADRLVSHRDDYLAAARELAGTQRPYEFPFDVHVSGAEPRAGELRSRLAGFGLRLADSGNLASSRHFVVLEGADEAQINEIVELARTAMDGRRLVLPFANDEASLAELAEWRVRPDQDDITVDIVNALAAVAEGGTLAERSRIAGVVAGVGQHFLAQGDIGAARKQAELAGEVAPHWLAVPQVLHGEISFHEGDLDGAQTSLENAVRTAPAGSPEAVSALLLLGKIAGKRGEFEKACDYFDRALAGTAGNARSVEVLRANAEAAVTAGRFPEAEELLEKALELALSPRDEAVLSLEIGRLLATRGNVRRAQGWLSDAVATELLTAPEKLTALRHLADAAENAGNHPQAAAYLRQVVQSADDPDDRVDATIRLVDLLTQDGLTGDARMALDHAFGLMANPLSYAAGRLYETQAQLHISSSDSGRLTNANDALLQARKAYQAQDDRLGEVRVLAGLADIAGDAQERQLRLGEANRLLSGLRGPEADSLRREVKKRAR